MAELAIGVVGLVPLVGIAIKSYRHVSTKLKDYRHYCTRVQRVQKKLKFQRRVFANECHILLRLVVEDDETISEMMADPDHERWENGTELNLALRGLLKENYEAWLDAVQDICDTISGLEEGLRCFDELTKHQRKGEKLKDTIRRVRDGIKVAFNAKDYDQAIENSREGNNQLKGLREQISELQRLKSHVPVKDKTPTPGEWVNLVKIRRASKALHDALSGVWNCSQAGHMGHVIKLFVETDHSEGEVQMKLAILCHAETRSIVQSTLLQLEVRSQNLEWIQTTRLCKRMPQPDNYGQRPRKRPKVVRFEEAGPCPPLVGTAPADHGQQTRQSTCDLGLCKDFCMELTRQVQDSPAKLGADCLGHLDVQSEEAFRHSFYPAKGAICGVAPSPPERHKTVPIEEILDGSASDIFSAVDKLKLARSLVSTTLKFHSTPWLRDYWGLRDLAFFQNGGEEIPDALRTLHVGVEIRRHHPDLMEDIQALSYPGTESQVSEDERLFCGIDNMTLHSLGVALLQIDRWTKVDPSDILAVRKLALRSSSLGPRFQEITRKCLRCDFGYGSDLTKPRLQEAIYVNVVGVLESMIASLDLGCD